MTLGQLRAIDPNAKVRVHFRNETGATGSLVCGAAHAIQPCASMRFFPPPGMTASDLGWPVPYWYANEVAGVTDPSILTVA